MTQVQPPGPGVPVIPVEVPILPIPQSWDIAEGQANVGKVAFVTFTSPLSVHVVMLDQAAALKLADKLREMFTGITAAPASALTLLDRAKRP